MTNHGGSKRSSSLIFRRRLTLIRILLRRPHSCDALSVAMHGEMQGDGSVGDVVSALTHDFAALKLA
jgi:hypothetical protein